MYSFPLVNLERLAIPALNAPMLFNTPITPPIINTNKIISIVSYTPLIGDRIISIIPCGLCSTFS